MIKTQNFKTKTIFQPRQNPMLPETWVVAIDVGYSGVKSYSGNSVNTFPASAVQVSEEKALGILETNKTDIIYRDELNGETRYFYVGDLAETDLSNDPANSAGGGSQERDHYYTPAYLVTFRTGIALASIKNQYADPWGRPIRVMTGLPPKFLKEDAPVLKELFAIRHKFALKIGKNGWVDFDFTLKTDDISVMSQPMGTLMSICFDKSGGQLPVAKEYFTKNVLVFDPGFRTLDTFDLRNRTPQKAVTYKDLGMRAVLIETARLVEADTGVTLDPDFMQSNLASGTFIKFNRRAHKSEEFDLTPYLDKANKTVANKALDQLDNDYEALEKHQYLVVTGGTGAAWYSIIQDRYKEQKSLKVILGADNDTLDPIFTNVRGYYMQLLNTLKRK